MFNLHVTHTATTEAGMATFLIFVRDTYATAIMSAFADSDGLACGANLTFKTLDAVISAVQAFKAQFTIQYRMVYS